MTKKRFFILCLISMVLFSGCSKLLIEKPEGFAIVSESKEYKAVSPEGVAYRVRVVQNYPEKNLEFWKSALKNQLVKEGYMLITDEETFQASGKEGVFFEWAVPYMNKNYAFLTGILVYGKRIALVEAAGDLDLFARYRNSILGSMKTIRLE